MKSELRANERKFNREASRALQAPSTTVTFTSHDQAVLRQVQRAIPEVGEREHDVFVCFVFRDGESVATELHDELAEIGLSVVCAPRTFQAGKSITMQMNEGLRTSRAGVVVCTPAFLEGTLMSERELGALLHKDTVIPVAHGVTFEEISDRYPLVGDLLGYETAVDSISVIAEKIAYAVGH